MVKLDFYLNVGITDKSITFEVWSQLFFTYIARVDEWTV